MKHIKKTLLPVLRCHQLLILVSPYIYKNALHFPTLVTIHVVKCATPCASTSAAAESVSTTHRQDGQTASTTLRLDTQPPDAGKPHSSLYLLYYAVYS